jgi:hypothetical protein
MLYIFIFPVFIRTSYGFHLLVVSHDDNCYRIKMREEETIMSLEANDALWERGTVFGIESSEAGEHFLMKTIRENVELGLPVVLFEVHKPLFDLAMANAFGQLAME